MAHKPTFVEWYESMEYYELREQYVREMMDKDIDGLIESVFWWESKLDAVAERDAWESWLRATYEIYLKEDRPDEDR